MASLFGRLSLDLRIRLLARVGGRPCDGVILRSRASRVS